jgi:NDP-sugar pyrophosphorylase family protein
VSALSLVVLAAGIGSRFGGTKQLAEVGPAGEAILDYTIHDARRAGFERIVLIVRTDLVDLVRAHLARHHGARLDYELVLQDAFGPRRAKPWGTGHALLATEGAVPGAMGVVNADDFYGRAAFDQLAEALRADAGPTTHHLIAYRLARTLSASGTVSRGVCEVGAEGELRTIVENLAIERVDDGSIVSHDSGARLADDTLVSMNLWGLQPSLYDALRRGWAQFLADHADDPKAEFLLPTVVGDLVRSGTASVRTHATDSTWLGITYPDDLEDVRARVHALVAEGAYPSPLSSG